ncbi:MAG: nucleotidyl transferase AbiEii/AbiGii toxin family protein [Bacteroidetes bacterium]|nr:nucleotidyl transferase AbiEii/AbiGii toxin family protein [Bacteroidota bacterium]
MIEKEFAIHKAQMYRLLIALADNQVLASNIAFKGGTCAKMLGYLDRLSVDLDFDITGQTEKVIMRKELHAIFQRLGIQIKDESDNALQFFLKYNAPAQKRNTLKLEILDKKFRNNKYAATYLPAIDRIFHCQTRDTIFANKLVALFERFENTGNIAGRDLYDIHHFFINGFQYNSLLIEERRNAKACTFFEELISFIRDHVTQKVIDQDINMLLPKSVFSRLRNSIKQETLMFLEYELKMM